MKQENSSCLCQLFLSVFDKSILMMCTNFSKLNGLVEIIAAGKEFFVVGKSTIISLIMFNRTDGFGA
jgi:hypothetical protein